MTWCSDTGVLVFLKFSSIVWHSKQQAKIESSTFGSDVVLMQTFLELVKEIRYKLRMMRVPIDGPSGVY